MSQATKASKEQSQEYNPEATSLKEGAVLFFRIINYLGPYKWSLFFAIALSTVASLLQISQAIFVKWLMNISNGVELDLDKEIPLVQKAYHTVQQWFPKTEFVNDSVLESLKIVIVLFLSLMLIKVIANFLTKYLIAVMNIKATQDLSLDTFAHLQEMDLSYFEKNGSGTTINKITAEIGRTVTLYEVLETLVRKGITLFSSFALMLYIDWRITASLFLIVPVFGVFSGVIGSLINRSSKRTERLNARNFSLIVQNLILQPIVKIFNLEQKETEAYEERLTQLNEERLSMALYRTLLTPVNEYLGFIFLGGLTYIGISYVLKHPELTIADVSEYLVYIMMIIDPIRNLSDIYSKIQVSLGASEKVFELLDQKPDVVSGSRLIENFHGEISFQNIDFAYVEGQPVLNDITLNIPAKATVGIVGPNGAGKSTFSKLIPRLYDATGGTIEIDGIPLKELDLDEYRKNLAIVTQESLLFQGTIKENILRGNLDASMDDVYRVAKQAQAHDMIMELPLKYETQVGERGAKLSGGQRQRVALARALIRDPKIVILDEYTAGIDTETEQALTETIQEIFKDVTCVIIAHRYSTLIHADTIFVLDQGKLVEQGSHQQLLERNGLYTELYTASEALNKTSSS